MHSKEELLTHLKNETQVFQNPVIEAAFTAVDRKDFVREDYEVEAYEDYPLPIEYDQTISQPTIVAFMLELLDPQKGDTVLDVGSGSGWSTALLAHIVGEEGEVYGVERILELAVFGQENLNKYNLEHAEIVQAKDELGLPEHMPYDRILVSAAASKRSIADELLKQLKVGGEMVMPIAEDIVVFEKVDEEKVEEKKYEGFLFVPLILE